MSALRCRSASEGGNPPTSRAIADDFARLATVSLIILSVFNDTRLRVPGGWSPIRLQSGLGPATERPPDRGKRHWRRVAGNSPRTVYECQAKFRVPNPGWKASKLSSRPLFQTSHCHFIPEDRLAITDPVGVDCANPATSRQVDREAQRRSCTSVAALRRESSCHSQDSGRGGD
jgi:hypothetical protein